MEKIYILYTLHRNVIFFTFKKKRKELVTFKHSRESIYQDY